MAHPFAWVHAEAEPRLLLVLTLLLLALSVWLAVIGSALLTEAAPRGILSFELARTGDRAEAILASWSPEARERAFLTLGVDALYLCVYPACFALAARRLSLRLRGGWRRAGVRASWLVLLAAPLDALENAALLLQLSLGASAGWAALAWASAVPKFGLVAGAGIYLLLGVLTLARRARTAHTSDT